jgi:hypothetical protein
VLHELVERAAVVFGEVHRLGDLGVGLPDRLASVRHHHADQLAPGRAQPFGDLREHAGAIVDASPPPGLCRPHRGGDGTLDERRVGEGGANQPAARE